MIDCRMIIGRMISRVDIHLNPFLAQGTKVPRSRISSPKQSTREVLKLSSLEWLTLQFNSFMVPVYPVSKEVMGEAIHVAIDIVMVGNKKLVSSGS
jgi:hypothetical protein